MQNYDIEHTFKNAKILYKYNKNFHILSCEKLSINLKNFTKDFLTKETLLLTNEESQNSLAKISNYSIEKSPKISQKIQNSLTKNSCILINKNLQLEVLEFYPNELENFEKLDIIKIDKFYFSYEVSSDIKETASKAKEFMRNKCI